MSISDRDTVRKLEAMQGAPRCPHRLPVEHGVRPHSVTVAQKVCYSGLLRNNIIPTCLTRFDPGTSFGWRNLSYGNENKNKKGRAKMKKQRRARNGLSDLR